MVLRYKVKAVRMYREESYRDKDNCYIGQIMVHLLGKYQPYPGSFHLRVEKSWL